MIKTVLVTGGAGYVGAVLVPKLLKIGYRVKVFDWFLYDKNVFKEYRSNSQLEEIHGDIRDTKQVSNALRGVDAVVHLACISNDPSFELDPALGKSINYDATKQLVDLSLHAGVKRFVYASSSSVYGVKKEREVTEELPLTPLTDYSKYKVLCEEYIVSKKSEGMTTLILRPATVCGYSPRMRFDLTVNMLTLQALVNKKITVYGGRQLRPNIHIKDMVEAYLQSLSFPARLIHGKTYNVGYENYSVLEIARMIKRTLGDSSISIDVSPTNDLRSYKITSKKIEQELGFAPAHTIEDAVLDIKRAFNHGKFQSPLRNPSYYNIKMMQNGKII